MQKWRYQRKYINFRILLPAISAAPAACLPLPPPASTSFPSSSSSPESRQQHRSSQAKDFPRSESTRLRPMGSLMSCLSDPCPSGNRSPPLQAKRRSSTSSRGRGGRDSAKASVSFDEEALAAAAALVLGQRGAAGGLGAFERSASVRYAAKRQSQGPPLPRSSSTRPRSLADPELQPQQLLAKVRTLPYYSFLHSLPAPLGLYSPLLGLVGHWCACRRVEFFVQSRLTLCLIFCEFPLRLAVLASNVRKAGAMGSPYSVLSLSRFNFLTFL